MRSEADKRLDQIFSRAIDLAGEERDAYIEDQCRNDAAMSAKLRLMLAAAADESAGLESTFDDIRNRVLHDVFEVQDSESEDLSGALISIWRIDSLLARGGLATVYRAHRDDGAYTREVAFKVLRRGLDTDDLIARFRAERQILSTLEHPAIAQLLDGGALEDGRPFLVMEYVDGLPITEYCELNQLDERDRVRLVIDVLEAIHHAHKHLVVHRDIKPSNILVSHGNRLTLLDFGIAKVLDSESMSIVTARTRTGVSLLTPGYGSPEQRAGQAVTTSSDVFQVGAVLFQLLARQPPDLGSFYAEQEQRMLPSRSAASETLAARIRGDLDAIVAKAMHFDPAQRYASANAMMADLSRFLDGQPVLARPDSLWYRFGKLNRRKPWLAPVSVAAVVLLATYIYTLNRYNQQIRTEQERSLAATKFMQDLLSSADPYAPADSGRGKELTVVEALDIGLERLQSSYYGEDEILRASLLVSIADGFANLDEHQKTIQTRLEALALERKLYGNISKPVIKSVRMLAENYRTIGQYVTAGPFFVEQYESSQAFYPPEHPEIGVAELAYGQYLYRIGRTDESISMMENAVRKLRTAPGEYTTALLNAIVWVSRMHPTSRGEEMLLMLEEALEMADSGGVAAEPMGGLVRTQIAEVLTQLGRYEEAEDSFDEAIAIYQRKLGRGHGATLIALTGLGKLYFSKGDFSKAEAIHTEVLNYYMAKYGVAHRGVAIAYQNLGRALEMQGKLDQAIDAYRLSYQSESAVLGADNPLAYRGLLLEAQAHLHAGDTDLASEAARGVIQAIEPLENKAEVKEQAECLLSLAGASDSKAVSAQVACL